MPFSDPDVRTAAMYLISSKWENQAVLDIGIGDGYYGEALHRKFNAIVYGVEVWPKYIVNQLLYYRTIFLCDARTFEYEMLAKKIRLVILGDVVEHLEKPEAIVLINRLKNIFPWLVMTIPIVDVPQGAYAGNIHETHRHQWKVPEIEGELGLNLIKNCGMCGLFSWGGLITKQIIRSGAILMPEGK